jgi:hypothetical protein
MTKKQTPNLSSLYYYSVNYWGILLVKQFDSHQFGDSGVQAIPQISESHHFNNLNNIISN